MSAEESPLVNFLQQLLGPPPSVEEMKEMARNTFLDQRTKMAETRRLYENYKDAEFVGAILDTCEQWIAFIERGVERDNKTTMNDITPDVASAFSAFHAGVARWIEAMHECAVALPKRTDDNNPDKA